MGPRQGENEVLGRYAIHFHADYDGSRGSVVDGVAVYDSTGHAFASHLSDGVTFRDCVAHDLVDDAFWWDLSLDGGGRDLVPSNDIVYERCVAHFVKSGGNSKFNLTGFLMGAGDGNIARGCVATGVEGGAESSAGFHWPSHSRDDNTWTFEDNVAHNNRHSGIYFWQNGAPAHDRHRLHRVPLRPGHLRRVVRQPRRRTATARSTPARTTGSSSRRCRPRRASDSGETITYDGMYIDQAGLSDYAVAHHQAPRPRRPGHARSPARRSWVAGGPRSGCPTAATTRSCTTSSTARSTATSSGWPTTCSVGDRAAGHATRAPGRTPSAAPTSRATPRRSGTPSSRRPDPAPISGVTSAGPSSPSSVDELGVRVGERAPPAGRGQRSGSGGGAGRRWPADVDEVAPAPTARSPTKSRIRRNDRRRVGEEVLAAHDEQALGGEVLEPPGELLGVPAPGDVGVPQQRHRVVRGIVARGGRDRRRSGRARPRRAASKSSGSWPRPTMWW